MKTAHTFSFLRTTSDIFASSLSQRKASATFVFRHLSLLLASRRRELLLDWTIGDATPGSTCMFPGTLPRRLDSQRVSPHPLYNRFTRDTSPGAAKSPDFTRTFVWIYNPRKAGNLHHSPSKKTEYQPNSHNQQDSLKSASHSRTRKILSNRQDYIESARLPNATDSRHGFPSIEPLPSTARHSFRASVVVRLQSSRDPPDFCGFVGCDTRASSPCLVVLV